MLHLLHPCVDCAGCVLMCLAQGHEDLRQDERVMQLFGLVNTMLAHDRATAERGLSIARYAVIPLSPNTGLIGWVPNCDTLHALIREFRDGRKIPLNWEHRLMLGMAPDYDHLTVIQKVEVFEYALESTSGEDLHKVRWGGGWCRAGIEKEHRWWRREVFGSRNNRL